MDNNLDLARKFFELSSDFDNAVRDDAPHNNTEKVATLMKRLGDTLRELEKGVAIGGISDIVNVCNQLYDLHTKEYEIFCENENENENKGATLSNHILFFFTDPANNESREFYRTVWKRLILKYGKKISFEPVLYGSSDDIIRFAKVAKVDTCPSLAYFDGHEPTKYIGKMDFDSISKYLENKINGM